MLFSEIAGDSGIFVDGDWIEKKDQDPNGKVRLIQLADIGEGHFLDKSNRFITESKAEELHCTFLKKGDILIARLGEPLCKACVFPYEGLYITAVDIAILRIDSDRINPEYIVYLVNSPWFKEAIKPYESGTTRKRISRKNLNRIDIDIPSIAKQNQVVSQIEESLSQLDSAVETLKKTKQQLEVYRQAVLKDVLADKPKWTRCHLGDVIDVLTDYHSNGSYKVLKENVTLLDDPSYAIMVRSTNFEKNDFHNDLKYIDEHSYRFLKKSQLFGGEVLMGKIGNAGKVYYMKKLSQPMSLAMNMFAMRFKESVLSKYVYYYLLSPQGKMDIKRYVKGVGTPTIDKKSVRSLLFAYPSLEEQEQVVNVIEQKVSSCDSIEQTVNRSLQQAEALRQSILKQAFEGE